MASTASNEARMNIKDLGCVQLYSASTPNGWKAAAMLEELVHMKANEGGFKYEAHFVDITKGESRSTWFAKMTPHGKIPLLVDPMPLKGTIVTVFESGAILLYLAEKYEALLPPHAEPTLRADTLKWLFWGSAAVSFQFKTFGFYYKHCAHNLPYCIQRYSRECNRLLGVLETQLASHGQHWVVGDAYTIADISIWPWLHALHHKYDDAIQAHFDDLKAYPAVKEWYMRCLARPTSVRALHVTPFI